MPVMNADLRLVVVAQEFPYPPNHGGRADVWRRLRAMKSLGVKLALVCWFDDADRSRPSSAERQAVEEVVDVLLAMPIKRGIRQDFSRLTRIAAGVPSHAAARMFQHDTAIQLIDRLAVFKPAALLLDSPYGGVFARSVCHEFNIPMFYRSHNIEHKYFAGQSAAAVGLRDRLAWAIACLHLADFEKRMMNAAEICFDISADDAAFWRAHGVRNGKWLPPLPEAALDGSPSLMSVADEDRELVFLGNLNAPNNVRGVRWLVEQVMPIVWQRRPGTALTVAGSRPSNEVRTLIANYAQVQLIEHVPYAPHFLATARVLINPVQTGSGVNVKTLDMLMTDRPIVSTSQGVAGLVPSIKSLCAVADSAEQFASAILLSLEAPAIDGKLREAGRVLFSTAAVANAVDSICSVVRNSTATSRSTTFAEGAG